MAGSSWSAHEDKLSLDLPGSTRLLEELARQPKVRDYLGDRLDATSFLIEPAHRGVLKQASDRRRLSGGRPGRLHRRRSVGRQPARPRPLGFAISRARLSARRGRLSSTPAATSAAAAVSLCCPAGPARPSSASLPWRWFKGNTLVLTTSITAVKQWHREILDKTDLHEKDIAEYTGECQGYRPGHRRHLSDSDAPPRQGCGVSSFQIVRSARLGSDHL